MNEKTINETLEARSRRRNLNGQVFGRLTAIGLVLKDGSRHSHWLCRCSCRTLSVVKASHLLTGNSKSCGCLKRSENKLCSVPGCGLKFRSLGYCTKHYSRLARYGSVTVVHEMPTGADAPNYKGESAGYGAKHTLLSKQYGKASHCENPECKSENPVNFEWANLSGEYKRDRSDWMQLCVSCHRRMDHGNACKRGHEYNEANTNFKKNGRHRECKVCRRMHDARRRAERKAINGK